MNQIRLLLVFCTLFMFTTWGYGKKPGNHVANANAFISTLEAAQKQQVLQPFYKTAGHEWAYIPAYTSHPAGVAYKDLNSAQQQAANTLLQSYLSTKGYQKTKSIMDLEPLLQVLEPNNPARIPGNYFIAIYGTPHEDSAWGWSFQGHHVVLNFTVVKDKIAFAPFFFGSNPGEVMEGPKKGLRILQEEEDIAYSLMNSFSETQKAQAIFLEKAPNEIITAAAIQVTPLETAGISIKEFTPAQKAILNKLLVAYLAAMPQELANLRYKKLQSEDMADIHFAWAGTLTKHEPHYYRVQGKTFLIEFDNTQNNANHIHTVWRDFNGDFGKDVLQEHYKASHH